jgi:predicted metal-dependent peptidase
VSWFKRDDRIKWLEALDTELLTKAVELIDIDGILVNRS